MKISDEHQSLGIRPGAAGRRYRTLVHAGMHPAVITDMTRTTLGASKVLPEIAYIATSGGRAAANEAVGFEDSLRLFPISNARVGYEDRYKGTIAKGKLGDFAVLSADPRDLALEKLFNLKVQATILGERLFL
jgi:predicted amidohydrolase YtcJ